MKSYLMLLLLFCKRLFECTSVGVRKCSLWTEGKISLSATSDIEVKGKRCIFWERDQTTNRECVNRNDRRSWELDEEKRWVGRDFGRVGKSGEE